jgi:pyridoxine kinase
MTPTVLSIQSRVAYGHVGNDAAVLPLQRQGFEVVTLDTVALAHHPGYGGFVGRFEDPDLLMTMLRSLERNGALEACTAVLSGYLGAPEVARVIDEALRLIRARHPGALYCCDPVIGDTHTGVFVKPGIEEAFRRDLARRADVLVPNVFELARLSGMPVENPVDALRAADRLRADGARIVVASGLPLTGQPERLAMLAVGPDGAWQVDAPRRQAILHGTGDLFSALILGQLLRGRPLDQALAAAASSALAVVDRTLADGRSELALIAAQDALVAPPLPLTPVRVR